MTHARENSASEGYLKKENGSVYGPASFVELKVWASEGRIAPKDSVSADGKNWSPAPDWKQLAMNWSVTLPDGSLYGPIHLMALPDLLREGIVHPHAYATNRESGEKFAVTEALVGALLDHNSSLLQSVSNLRQRLRDAGGSAKDGGPAKIDSETQKWLNDLRQERDRIQENAEEWRQKWEAAAAEAAEKIKELTQVKDRLKSSESEAKKQIAKLEREAKQAARKAESTQAPKNGSSVELDKLKEQFASLQKDAASWREKFEKAQRPAGAGDAHRGGPERNNGNSSAFKELNVQNDDLKKEVARWKKMYEEEQEGTSKRESELNARVDELRKSEAAARSRLEKTTRQLRHTERSYDMILRASEAKEDDDEPSAAVQIAMLINSHSELSQCHDSLYTQFQANTDALHAALEDRERIEQRADRRVHDMEEVLQREQEEAERARKQFAEIQDSHFQLLKSYREMNDRLIRFLQKARQSTEEPKQRAGAPAPSAAPKDAPRGPKIRLNR